MYVRFDAAAAVVATVVVVATELTLNSLKQVPNTSIQKLTVQSLSVKISISGDK